MELSLEIKQILNKAKLGEYGGKIEVSSSPGASEEDIRLINELIGVYSKKIKEQEIENTRISELYESILDTLPLPVSVSDNKNSCFFVNKAAEKTINKTRSSLIGKNIDIISGFERRDDELSMFLLDSQKNNRDESCKEQIVQKNGVIYQISLCVMPQSSGMPGGNVTIFRDISSCYYQMSYAGECLSLFNDAFSRYANGILDDTVDLPISKGDSSYIQKKGVSLLSSLNNTRKVIKLLKEDTFHLLQNIEDGVLNYDHNYSDYNGEFQKTGERIHQAFRSVSRIVSEIKRVCDCFVSYDFTATIDAQNDLKGDWKHISDSLNIIGKQITEAFGSINHQVMELSANVEEADASVQEVAHSSDLLAKSSSAVSGNTEQSDAGVRQVLRAMEDLSVTVGDVSQKADSVSRLAHEGTQLAREGSDFAKKAEAGMGLITSSAEEADLLIGQIQDEMKKINEIVRLITEIANQTNLLALNAAIEAARAGEMGRGFAVVASEVKALALESRSSAEKITDMIGSLQKQSKKAADAVSGATVAVRDGNILLSDTLGIFGRLAGSVEEISINIEQVASMNEEQAAAVEEITSSMHEVSAMLKDTAREAVESATATNEASASVKQLQVIVDQVAEIAEQVSVSTSKFTL